MQGACCCLSLPGAAGGWLVAAGGCLSLLGAARRCWVGCRCWVLPVAAESCLSLLGAGCRCYCSCIPIKINGILLDTSQLFAQTHTSLYQLIPSHNCLHPPAAAVLGQPAAITNPQLPTPTCQPAATTSPYLPKPAHTYQAFSYCLEFPSLVTKIEIGLQRN